MSGCFSGRPTQQMLLNHATGRVLTSLISLRGWTAAAAPPQHGHAARWRASTKARAAAQDGSTATQRPQDQQHERQKLPDGVPTTPTSAFGKVMQAQANFVRVRIDRVSGGQVGPPPQLQLLCVVRTLLKKIKQTVLVGDEVEVTGIDWADGRGMVQEVLDRRNAMTDPAIANIDQALMVFSLAQPPFEPPNATRFLVSAEAAGIPVTLVLNKADLLPPDELDFVVSKVRSWGYTPVTVSARSGLGLQPLLDALVGKVSVFAGPSGVGKSSLLNALKRNETVPDAAIRSAERTAADEAAAFEAAAAAAEEADQHRVAAAPAGTDGDAGSQAVAADDNDHSQSGNGGAPASRQGRIQWSAINRQAPTAGRQSATSNGTVPAGDEIEQLQAVSSVSAIGRGKHTTRTVTLLPLRSGGLIADTPGFNQPALEVVTAEELPGCFPEIAAALREDSCRFANCQHVHEPGCAVRGDWERYPFYLELLDEVKAKDERERHRSASKKAREGNVRVKTGKGGTAQREALLDSNKHRKQSRKRVNQTIRQTVSEQLDEDLDEYL